MIKINENNIKLVGSKLATESMLNKWRTSIGEIEGKKE